MPPSFASLVLALANVAVYLLHPRLVLTFRQRMGYWPNVATPRSKNEKFLWRKVFDRNPLYRLMSDKIAVREFVAARCPGLAMAEIVWVGPDPREIPDALLRPGVVIKANNGSDRNIFIRAASVDRAEIERKVARWIARPHGRSAGEWVYALIHPLAFIEKVIEPPTGGDLLDIMCYVVAGKCLLVAIERNMKKPNAQLALYDPNGNRYSSDHRSRPAGQVIDELPPDYPVPPTFARAVAQARVLGADSDFVRIDFMSAGDRLYFCECTTMPLSGLSVISGGIDDAVTAAWDLRNAWFMRTRPGGPLRRLYARALDATLRERDTATPSAPS